MTNCGPVSSTRTRLSRSPLPVPKKWVQPLCHLLLVSSTAIASTIASTIGRAKLFEHQKTAVAKTVSFPLEQEVTQVEDDVARRESSTSSSSVLPSGQQSGSLASSCKNSATPSSTGRAGTRVDKLNGPAVLSCEEAASSSTTPMNLNAAPFWSLTNFERGMHLVSTPAVNVNFAPPSFQIPTFEEALTLRKQQYEAEMQREVVVAGSSQNKEPAGGGAPIYYSSLLPTSIWARAAHPLLSGTSLMGTSTKMTTSASATEAATTPEDFFFKCKNFWWNNHSLNVDRATTSSGQAAESNSPASSFLTKVNMKTAEQASSTGGTVFTKPLTLDQLLAFYPTVTHELDTEKKPLAKRGPLELPNHVGVVMDGNGRWASSRGFHRSAGHSEAEKNVRELIETAAKIGIPQLTLYAFSSDNWKRPKDEVQHLMARFTNFLTDPELRKQLKDNEIQLRVIGDLSPPFDDFEVVSDTTSKSSARRGSSQGKGFGKPPGNNAEEGQPHVLDTSSSEHLPTPVSDGSNLSSRRNSPREDEEEEQDGVMVEGQGGDHQREDGQRSTNTGVVVQGNALEQQSSAPPFTPPTAGPIAADQAAQSFLPVPPTGVLPQRSDSPDTLASTISSVTLKQPSESGGSLFSGVSSSFQQIQAGSISPSWCNVVWNSQAKEEFQAQQHEALCAKMNQMNLLGAAGGQQLRGQLQSSCTATGGASSTTGSATTMQPVVSSAAGGVCGGAPAPLSSASPTSSMTRLLQQKAAFPLLRPQPLQLSAMSTAALGGPLATGPAGGGDNSSLIIGGQGSSCRPQGHDQQQLPNFSAVSTPTPVHGGFFRYHSPGRASNASSIKEDIRGEQQAEAGGSPTPERQVTGTSSGNKDAGAPSTATAAGLQLNTELSGVRSKSSSGQSIDSLAQADQQRQLTTEQVMQNAEFQRQKSEQSAAGAPAADGRSSNETKKQVNHDVDNKKPDLVYQLSTEERQKFRALIQEIHTSTRKHKKMRLNILLSYSSSWELQEAMKRMHQDHLIKKNAEFLDWDFEKLMSFMGIDSEIDLLVRTGDQQRLSEFCLPQLRYAEILFESKYFPDYHADDFVRAVQYFNTKQRRRGKTPEQIQKEEDEKSREEGRRGGQKQ
ncbi:unnamed protein product [Amoebophrya sp. A120]|nr:unnamed protein product [Amoebophrya sp. A120]|eukprot:GSA120T00012465001.1